MFIVLLSQEADGVNEVFRLQFIIVLILITKNISGKRNVFVKQEMNADTKNGVFILIVISALLKNVTVSVQDFAKNTKSKNR